MGLIGGTGNFVNGGNVKANAELRMRDAGIGGVENQVESAWDVLSGRMTPEEAQARQTDALKKLGLSDAQIEAYQNGYNFDISELYGENENARGQQAQGVRDAYFDISELYQENGNRAESAQTEVTEILSGTVSNSRAEAILSDPALRAAFEEMSGVKLAGTKSEQRAAIKEYAAKMGGQEQKAPRGRTAEQKEAAERKSYEQSRRIVQSQSEERQTYLKQKRAEFADTLNGLKAGDKVYLNGENAPAFGVISASNNGMTLEFYNEDGEVFKYEHVLPETFTGDMAISLLNTAESVNVQSGQGQNSAAQPKAQAFIGYDAETGKVSMRAISLKTILLPKSQNV